jgi:hypothetical protein
MVGRGVISIDGYHNNTSNKALFEGHYFSDKAPGIAFLALPSFALSSIVLRGFGISLDSDRGWLFSSWFSCAVTAGVMISIGAVALFEWLRRRVSARSALVTTLAVYLGAAPLPYSTLMFSHAVVVALLSISIWAIERQEQTDSATESDVASPRFWFKPEGWKYVRWLFLAGSAFGLAIASEYTTSLPALGVLVWAFLTKRRGAVAFCAAASIPLLLIPLYSLACFGNPLVLPYSLQADLPEMREGFYSIKWPDAETASQLLFGPKRGLFFWSPFLVMAAFGYRRLLHSCPKLFWLCYVVSALQIVVLSGRTWDWEAGATLGPRYLAPILPFLALPCALAMERLPYFGLPLVAYSVLITTLATLTDACPIPEIHNPLLELHLPLLFRGDFSPNVGMLLGLSPPASVIAYYFVLIGGVVYLWRIVPRIESPNPQPAGSEHSRYL